MTKTAGEINFTFVTVVNAIAALTFSGIAVKSLDEVPENALLLCPILYPKPDGFISGLSPSLETFGTFGTEQMTLRYNLTFRYLHSQISGGLGGLFQVYAGLITNVAAIAKIIMTNDTLSGADNVRLQTITQIGPTSDPAGNQYHGCDFIVSVEEYT